MSPHVLTMATRSLNTTRKMASLLHDSCATELELPRVQERMGRDGNTKSQHWTFLDGEGTCRELHNSNLIFLPAHNHPASHSTTTDPQECATERLNSAAASVHSGLNIIQVSHLKSEKWLNYGNTNSLWHLNTIQEGCPNTQTLYQECGTLGM